MIDPTRLEVITGIIIGYLTGVYMYTPPTCADYDESATTGDNLLNSARDGNIIKLKYTMKWRLYSPLLWPICWYPTCHHCRMMSEYGYYISQAFEQATRNGHHECTEYLVSMGFEYDDPYNTFTTYRKDCFRIGPHTEIVAMQLNEYKRIEDKNQDKNQEKNDKMTPIQIPIPIPTINPFY